jgi:hypothetical protein
LERAKCLPSGSDRFDARSRVGQVLCDNGRRVAHAAQLASDSIQELRSPAAENHQRPAPSERQRDAAAYTCAPTGDQGSGALEFTRCSPAPQRVETLCAHGLHLRT